jgi:hypothetical protein
MLPTWERWSRKVFLLITGELERCLQAESQVMVPAGHGMHGQNAAFLQQAVAAFLRRH